MSNTITIHYKNSFTNEYIGVSVEHPSELPIPPSTFLDDISHLLPVGDKQKIIKIDGEPPYLVPDFRNDNFWVKATAEKIKLELGQAPDDSMTSKQPKGGQEWSYQLGEWVYPPLTPDGIKATLREHYKRERIANEFASVEHPAGSGNYYRMLPASKVEVMDTIQGYLLGILPEGHTLHWKLENGSFAETGKDDFVEIMREYSIRKQASWTAYETKMLTLETKTDEELREEFDSVFSM